MQADSTITARTDFLKTSAFVGSSATSSGKVGHPNLSLLAFQFCGMNQKSKHETLLTSKLSNHTNV